MISCKIQVTIRASTAGLPISPSAVPNRLYSRPSELDADISQPRVEALKSAGIASDQAGSLATRRHNVKTISNPVGKRLRRWIESP